MADLGDSLGPLPTFDSNAQLQEQSLNALGGLLKHFGQLVIRNEAKDYGVDISLEALVHGKPTNFRSQVQIKAVTSLAPNADGSRSKAIDCSNINYLLNGGASSLYLLYIADEDIFYYAWATDVRRELDEAKPDWMRNQSTVTIRFRDRLDANQLKAIHERILRQARLNRQIQNTLAKAATRESVSLAIRADTLETDDADSAFERLNTSGLSIVSNGFAHEALRLFDLLDAKRKATARMQLVCAYAWYSLGRYQKALGAIAEAAMEMSDLPRDDQDMLMSIRDTAEYQTGHITRDQLLERINQPEDAVTGLPRSTDEVDRLRFAYLHERDDTRRSGTLAELQCALRRIVENREYSPQSKILARVHVAYCEGVHRSLMIRRALSVIHLRANIRLYWARPALDELRSAVAKFGLWEQGMRVLIDQAAEAGPPLLLAEALRTRLAIRTSVLRDQRFAHRFLAFGKAPTQKAFALLQDDARKAMAIFQQADHLDGQLRAKMHLAELYELAGDVEAARKIAAEVLPLAQALHLRDVEENAREYTSGGSLLQKTEDSIKADREADSDMRTARLTDADLDAYVTTALEVSRLPRERRPAIRTDVYGYRQIARDRLIWCRHIQLIQDLDHTFDPAMAYVVTPTYYGQCTRDGFESIVGSRDPEEIITRFKSAFCVECRNRSPKLPASGNTSNAPPQ